MSIYLFHTHHSPQTFISHNEFTTSWHTISLVHTCNLLSIPYVSLNSNLRRKDSLALHWLALWTWTLPTHGRSLLILWLNNTCQLWLVSSGWRGAVFWCMFYCVPLWHHTFYFVVFFPNLAQEIMLWSPKTLVYEGILRKKILPDKQVDNYVPHLKKLDKGSLKIYIRRWYKINSALFLFLSTCHSTFRPLLKLSL